MFERFTTAARGCVTAAVRSAQERDAAAIGVEDLLTGLVEGAPDDSVVRRVGLSDDVLQAVRADLERARRRGGLSSSDVAALADLGIDVDAVVAQVERSYGEDALAGARGGRRSALPRRLPLDQDAKRTLARAVQEARDLGSGSLGDAHLLLGLVGPPTPVSEALAAHGITYRRVREQVA